MNVLEVGTHTYRLLTSKTRSRSRDPAKPSATATLEPQFTSTSGTQSLDDAHFYRSKQRTAQVARRGVNHKHSITATCADMLSYARCGARIIDPSVSCEFAQAYDEAATAVPAMGGFKDRWRQAWDLYTDVDLSAVMDWVLYE